MWRCLPSAVGAAYPQILLQDSDSVQREAGRVAELLGVDEMDAIVEEYPRSAPCLASIGRPSHLIDLRTGLRP
eukprot:scaffold473692_cov37-Prasinocladus_malaysianus.AAC.1